MHVNLSLKHATLQTFFSHVRGIGLPEVRVGRMEDKVAAWFQPASLQRVSGGHEGVGPEKGSLPYPSSGTRLEAYSVPLE